MATTQESGLQGGYGTSQWVWVQKSTYIYNQILHRQGTGQLGDLIAKLVYVLKQSNVNIRWVKVNSDSILFTPVFQLLNYYFILLLFLITTSQTDLDRTYYVDQVGTELVAILTLFCQG